MHTCSLRLGISIPTLKCFVENLGYEAGTENGCNGKFFRMTDFLLHRYLHYKHFNLYAGQLWHVHLTY